MGESLGVMTTKQAIALAEEKGLDLIETVPDANPPVAKILSFDKFRYQQEKEAKKKQQKTAELKHVRLSARSAENDLSIKAKKIGEFVEKGHGVEILLRLRGREKYNKEWAMKRMEHFITMIPGEYKILSPAKFAGQGILMQITKK